MIRKLTLMLIFAIFVAGDAIAERGEPIMSWPYFVQLDLNAYHGAMISKCDEKYPEHAQAFRKAIAQWDKTNMAAITEIRGLIKERIKFSESLSEAQAEDQMSKASAAWTQIFMNMLAGTKENEWKDACSGSYADQTLRSLDFQKYRSSIVAAISTVPISQLRP